MRTVWDWGCCGSDGFVLRFAGGAAASRTDEVVSRARRAGRGCICGATRSAACAALVERHGAGDLLSEFPKVQSRELSRAFPEFYNESAHNMFLDAGTAQGLPGLLILMAAVAFG